MAMQPSPVADPRQERGPDRVLYVVSQFPTLSETFIVREIHELLRLGLDIRIISLKRASERLVQADATALLDRVIYPAPPLVTAARAAVTLARHPMITLRLALRLIAGLASDVPALAKSFVTVWRTLAVVPPATALDIDHVHAHFATYPSTAAMLLGECLRVPFSFTSHAHDIFRRPQLLAEKLSRARFSVTISRFNRKFMLARTRGAGAGHLVVIHCGVPLDRFPFIRRNSPEPRVLAVGRLDTIKGFEVLIDACAVLSRRGRSFTCDIVGDGPLRVALQARIDRLGLSNRVVLHGASNHEGVVAKLASAAVFVLPSVSRANGDVMDGIPVSLMEAMASGVPVVSTPVSGIPELVQDGVSGLLAPADDAAGLADCIERLLTDLELAHTLANNARRRIESDFDVRRESRKLYTHICGNAHVSPAASAIRVRRHARTQRGAVHRSVDRVGPRAGVSP
jgi:glycosyltransferase involved in cell wall biosynthesis